MRTADVRRFLSTLNRWWWSWLWVVPWTTSLVLIVTGYATHSKMLRRSGEVVLVYTVGWMLSGLISTIWAYRRLRASRQPKRHEPTQGCHPIHCYSCNLDEPDHGAYIVCGECGHVYPTPRSLRRAWRAAERRALQFSNEGYRSTWRSWLADRILISWLQVTIRASRIYSCALCSHDW